MKQTHILKTKNLITKKDCSGVLLLEVLITILIVGIALVPVLGSFNQAIAIYIRAQEVSVSNRIAQREFERLKLNYKYTSNFSPVSSTDNTVDDIVTNNPLSEYKGWVYDMTVENNDITPNSQTLHGRLKKISLLIKSPKNNEFSYVCYFSTGGNAN